MKETKPGIKVAYSSLNINGELDDEIIKSMSYMGYEMWACGYDYRKNIRDLAFDAKENKI